MNDKAREAFEREYEAYCLPAEADWFRREEGDPDEYYHATTAVAWWGFQAALQWAASQQAPKTAEEMRPDFEWWWQTRGIFPPLGTREAAAAWGAWLASGGYKAPGDWKLSAAPWGWDEAAAPAQQAADEEELRLFEHTVEQFGDCNETDTDPAMLMKWAGRGWLECKYYEVNAEGRRVLASLAPPLFAAPTAQGERDA